MAKANHNFRKAERLKSRKAIEYLFRHGKSHTVPPFRMIYLPSDELNVPTVMTVSVPKRRFKRAVDRNLIKRRTKESYRLRKHQLYRDLEKLGRKYKLVFHYQADEILEYNRIDNAIGVLLTFLTNR